MINILIVAYSYVAALIGAGFASGQEILCYFHNYGRTGFIGVLLSCIVFTLYSYIVLRAGILLRPQSFNDFICSVTGKQAVKAISFFTGLFSFAVYSVMLSAVGELSAVLIPGYSALSSLICAVLSTLLICRGTRNTFDVNAVIGIIISIGIAVSCLYIIRYREFHTISQLPQTFTSTGIYCGYNLATAAPVLIVLSRRLNKPHDAAAAALTSGLILFFLMSLIFCILAMYSGRINLGEFPMLTMAARQNKLLSGIYFVMLTGSVLTTMLSSAGSMAEALTLKNRPVIIILLSACAYALSGAGFSSLINSLYRICGIAGIFICVFTLLVCNRYSSNKK